MKLITERTQIRDLASAWSKTGHFTEKEREERFPGVMGKLGSLDVETATAKDVEQILGGNSWCSPSICEECGESVNVAVEVGRDHYERTSTIMCVSCLEKAVALAKSEERQ